MSAKINYGSDIEKAIKSVNVVLADLRLMVSSCMLGALPPYECNEISYSSNFTFGGPQGLVVHVAATGGKSRWEFEFDLAGSTNVASAVWVSRHDGIGKPSLREHCKFSHTELEETVSRMAAK